MSTGSTVSFYWLVLDGPGRTDPLIAPLGWKELRFLVGFVNWQGKRVGSSFHCRSNSGGAFTVAYVISQSKINPKHGRMPHGIFYSTLFPSYANGCIYRPQNEWFS
jgi:hypothetical protein